ncbi:MAG: hypothetical protein KA521_02315 [Crocinitomicaceae bacterium]|nr:hypothetical protein [Crocinitomicaceae bacterium]
MQNRILLFLMLTSAMLIQAQGTLYSPYSTVGLGEQNNTEHPTSFGMGNASITLADSTILNFLNPASYSTLGDGQPLFSLGFNSRISTFTQNNATQNHTSATINHFALGFTLKKRYGLAFGIKPYSSKAYSIIEGVKAGTDSIINTYLGTGGTNQFFVGLSAYLFKNESTAISLGTNLSYLFGATNNERRSQLYNSNSAYGGVDWNRFVVSSFHYDFGLFMKKTLSLKHTFLVAATLDPSQKVMADKEHALFFGVLGNPTKYDTILLSPVESGSFKMPTSFTIGGSYTYWFTSGFSSKYVRNSEIALHVNYASTDWRNYSSSLENTVSSLENSYNLSIGLQFIPERKFTENTVNTSFFARVRYRAGYYQNTLPYSFNGEQFVEKGYTLGFGIPIIAQQSLSNLNVGFSYGTRTTQQTGSFNQSYYGIQFGVTIAPSIFERWFRKRRLD